MPTTKPSISYCFALEVDSIFHPERYPLVSSIHEPEEKYAIAPQDSKPAPT